MVNDVCKVRNVIKYRLKVSPHYQILLLMAFSTIFASAHHPIIELPEDYNRMSPWKQLVKLGLRHLTETDCHRECVIGELPRVCLHTWVFEQYAAMGTACGNCSNGVMEDCFRSQCVPADGNERGVMSINRQIPGPMIHACLNDLLVVNVKNKMIGIGLAIHWHGVSQKQNQWMDGATYVTQCPIGGETFTYTVPLEEAGTFSYHSHNGIQIGNGLYGALIVHQPRSEEPWPVDIYNYDLPEHVLILSDWTHETADMFFPGLPTRPPGIRSNNILINGLGRFLNKSDTDASFNVSHPLAIFHVERNKRYRLRIINVLHHICPVQMQIEDHNMILISIGANPIKPVITDTLISSSGERFDVIIDTCNRTLEKNSFWIHIRGLEVCDSIMKLQQYAVLSYGTNVSDLDIIPEGRRPTNANPLQIKTVVNDPNTTCGASPRRLCISDLQALGHDDDEYILTGVPDVRLIMPFDLLEFKNATKFHERGKYQKFANLQGESIRSGTFANISFEALTTPSMFSRDTEDTAFCDPQNLPDHCQTDDNYSISPFCECPHYVTVKKNAIVEMILIDVGVNNDSHPFHLHGYSFFVVKMGESITELEGSTLEEVYGNLVKSAQEASNSLSFIPALVDTVAVPFKRFVVIRFKADNSGDWLFHCHLPWHAIIGMQMLIRVQGEISEKPPGFPVCGNFDPLSIDYE